jgi:glycosyltransferase involved in cell wall biosynthesis
VSVIVPTYNRAAFLEGTLGSIFDQTVDVHEVLLVDDGSTDETRTTVETLLAKQPDWRGRLRYFRQPHAGKSVALNHALKFATGEWIAFNDSDDRWLPEKLALQFEALGEYEDADACYSDARYVNNAAMKQTAFEESLRDRTFPFGITRNMPALHCSMWPGVFMQTVLVNRDTLHRCGDFDTAMRMSMDTDFSFRLGLITPMCYVNMPLVEVDRTETRVVGLMTEYPADSIERMHAHEHMITKWLSIAKDSHPHLRRPLKARLSGAQSALANQYLIRGDFKKARVILGRAARRNPRPLLVAKYLWNVVAARSLRKEIIRRENAAGHALPSRPAFDAPSQRMIDASHHAPEPDPVR